MSETIKLTGDHARVDYDMHEEYGEAWAEYLDEVLGVLQYTQLDPDEVAESFEDIYKGQYDSMADYAQEVMEGTTPPEARESAFWQYIDWERYGNDLEAEGAYITRGGHVFYE